MIKGILPTQAIVNKWVELMNNYTHAYIAGKARIHTNTLMRALERKKISQRTFERLTDTFIKEEAKRKEREGKLCGL